MDGEADNLDDDLDRTAESSEMTDSILRGHSSTIMSENQGRSQNCTNNSNIQEVHDDREESADDFDNVGETSDMEDEDEDNRDNSDFDYEDESVNMSKSSDIKSFHRKNRYRNDSIKISFRKNKKGKFLATEHKKESEENDSLDFDSDKNRAVSTKSFKQERLENEDDLLQEFTDSLNTRTTNFRFTVDYFDTSVGILSDKDCPTYLDFSIAILREVLCNLKPTHELWNKIKFAAFLLNTVTRNVDFEVLYQIYHKVEIEVLTNNLNWSDREVEASFDAKIVDTLVVCNTDQEDEDDIEEHEVGDMSDGDNLSGVNITSDNSEAEQEEDMIVELDSDEYHNLVDGGSIETDQGVFQVVEVKAEPEEGEEGDEGEHEEDTAEDRAREVREAKRRIKKRRRKMAKRRSFLAGREKIAKTEARSEDEYDDLLEAAASSSSSSSAARIRFQGEFAAGEKLQNEVANKTRTRMQNTFDARDKLKQEIADRIRQGGGLPTKPEKKKKKHEMSCPNCRYKAWSQKQLDKHAFQMHGANRLCAQCGHLSSTWEDFSKHNETHLFTCEICQKKILGANGLKDHHVKVHGESLDTPRVSCDICGAYLRKTYMTKHIENVHGSEVHKCDLCGWTTNSKDKITWHRKRHFYKTEQCPVCSKVVKNLKYHYRLRCSGVRERHTCDLCKKTFTEKGSLDRHVRVAHDKIYDLACHFCEYKTYNKYNLRLHICKMHTKEDIQKNCPYCDLKTANVEYHIKIFHFDEYVKNHAGALEGSSHDV